MPPKQLDPTASLAHFLGAKVRKLRNERGWSQAELGRRVFVAGNRIAQIELATDPPNRALVEQLDQVLEAAGELIDLWHLHSRQATVPDWAAVFLARQAEAVHVEEFSNIVIPGLVQTPAYARELFESGRIFRRDGASVDDLTEARIGRQRIFEREDPPWLWIVLYEAALYGRVGSPEVMAEQLGRLLDVGAQERTTVQVLPYGKLAPAAVGGSLTVLTMPGGEQLAYTEGIQVGKLTEEPDDVSRHKVLYDQLQSLALDAQDSAALIQNVIEERWKQ